MISHKKKFILITPPRTASNTLRLALDKYLADHLGNHRSIAVYKKHLKGKFSNYKIFGVIRNPWSRLLSYWCFFKREYKGMSFEEFITNRTDIDRMDKDLLTDYFSIDNKVIVNKYINFDNLQQDFNTFCEEVDISKFILPIQGSTGECSLKIKECYTPKLFNIVKDKYKNEIKYFKYT
jgi:hypothetical protein